MVGRIRMWRWRMAQALEHRWWSRYLRDQDAGDYLRNKIAYWRRFLDDLDFTPRPGARVLDAGCGPAGIFLLLGPTQRVTALDPLLDTYAERLPEVFRPADHPGVRFQTGRLEDLTERAAYDTIHCHNAINHVADWGLALDRLTAACKLGGRMVLTSDVHRHGWLKPVFRLLPGDALHPQQHGVGEYRAALEGRGWRIVRERRLRRAGIFDYVGWVVELERSDC